MDLTETIQPNSDQLDSVDLLGGARTFLIERVSKGNAEQPVNIHLAEFPRPWRPGKSMRRVLVACWGADAAQYVGRRVRLYCDPEVVFGGAAVGGTRIAALSHIDKPKKVPLLVSRGKSAIFTVQPLPDAPAAPERPRTPTVDDLIDAAQKATTEAALDQIARTAVAALPRSDAAKVKAAYDARLDTLKREAETPAEPMLPEGAA